MQEEEFINITKLNSRTRLYFSNPLKLFTIVLLIGIAGAIFSNFILIIKLFNFSKNISRIKILYICTIFLYICIVIISAIEFMRTKKQNEKIHTLEDYNKTLLKVNDSICGFKHDFSNFVQALDGYVETNNMDGVKTMSKSILKECVCTRNLESLNPNTIKNGAIYSIISNKYFLAQSKKVDMNLEIVTDLKEVKEFSYEVCRILGILLDNAIEAASECNNGFINLRVLKDNKVERKLIIVENTYQNKNINIDKLFEKGYTSKEKDSRKHGLGLWNVSKILRKNNNLSLYTTKGELFSQQLEIYIKDE